MYDAEKPIDFIKEQPRPANRMEQAEMQQVAETFEVLLTDLFLAHIDLVKTLQRTEDGRSLYLELKIDAADDSRIEFHIGDVDNAGGGKRYVNKEILVIVRDSAEGWAIASFDYDLKKERRVLRTDWGDTREQGTTNQEILMFGDDEAVDQEIRRHRENLFANWDLEASMGLNNQPVGIEEMTKLVQLVWSAVPYVPEAGS